jgi:DNA (cytosine-5)-methyltransferase 1
MTLTFGSLFAGVGGFDMGFSQAGWDCKFQVEWDKNCQQILNKHWPDVPKWGDVSDVNGAEIPPVDCIIFGSPCQDLSVAGKRAGLEGERSGLFHEAVRIIKEMRDATNGTFPRWTVWENVAGALSSNNGRDFGTVINEMAKAGACLQEYALLDAQHFGIPQRRRRVFLVSCFDSATSERCPSPLLPVTESLRGDTKKSKPKGQSVTSQVADSVRGDGGILGSEIVGSLNTSDAKMISTQYVNENKCVVEPYVKSRRAQTSTDDETWVHGEVNPTLNSFDVGDTRATTAIVEPVLFENSYRDGARIANHGVTQTLSAKMGTGGGNTPMIAVPTYSFDTQFGSNANVTENVSPTLKASQQSPSIAYPIQDGREIEKHQNGFGVASDGEPSYTLDQTGAQAVAYSVREDAKANTFSATELDHANALSALRPSPQSHHAQMFIAQPMAVRRLTPLECERLMGWPDDHTRYKADGIEQADTHRYKQCGNGVATPVARWVASHIAKVEYAKG